MKTPPVLRLLSLCLAASALAEQPAAATTEDGRKVTIYPDGTWRLTKAAPDQGAAASTPAPKSQEGVLEHKYELNQDYTIPLTPGQSRRLHRGDIYPGRILADHAEIDIDGISYSVPRSILHPRVVKDATAPPAK
jgi:hypothetical protein